MKNLYLISASFFEYIILCEIFSNYEKNTKQRQVAYCRSIQNFFILLCINGILPFDSIRPSIANQYTAYQYTAYQYTALLVWFILADIIFTITHRLLHTKKLYWIHKQHHTNNPSYSTSTFDSHIVEFLFGNVCTGVLPMIIYKGTDTVQTLWITVAILNTVMSHTIEGPHLIHHKLLRYNYGQGFYLLDRIFNTYKDH